MEVIGFRYERSENQRIEAKGEPIPEHLLAQGYEQVDNRYGEPAYYVKRNRVLITLRDEHGCEMEYDIYKKIRILFPDWKKITLQRANHVYRLITTHQITVVIRNKELYLYWNNKSGKGGKGSKK